MTSAPWLVKALDGLIAVHGDRALRADCPESKELVERLGQAEAAYRRLAAVPDAPPETPVKERP